MFYRDFAVWIAFAASTAGAAGAQPLMTTAAGGGAGVSPAYASISGVPVDVRVDPLGRLVFADPWASLVTRVTSTGSWEVIAGDGTLGYGGDGGPARLARLYRPSGLAMDGVGNIYIADASNQRIRRVDALTGIITTVAGNGVRGFSGDGGMATAASLSLGISEWSPVGLAIDGTGHLFIADTANGRVRRVDAVTGVISTFAGGGPCSSWGDGGPAVGACLAVPRGIAFDPEGNLHVVQGYPYRRVRRVDAATGIISSVAGGDDWSSFENVPATEAWLDDPVGVSFDSAGNMFIADRDIDPLAGGFFRPIRRVDAVTRMLTVFAGNGRMDYCGDGGPALQACLAEPSNVTVDPSDNVLIPDTWNQRLRRIDHATGTINTLAGGTCEPEPGDGEPARRGCLNGPTQTVLAAGGDLFIADNSHHRVRIVDAVTGTIGTVAGTGNDGYGGDGGPATAARLSYPNGAAIDPGGNLYIADTNNNRVRRVDGITGIITTIAGSGVQGFGGDGGPAADAKLYYPRRVAFDPSGDLLVSDSGNHRIRRVDLVTGLIRTVAGDGTAAYSGDGGPAEAAELNSPRGMAFDGAGNLYFADRGNNRVRRIDGTSGIVTTVAGDGQAAYSGDGGPAPFASLSAPTGVALGPAGTLLVADTSNHRVRRVDLATGVISTVAGNGVAGFNGDGRHATDAALYYPVDVAIGGGGEILISDSGTDRIRSLVTMPLAAGEVPEGNAPGESPLEVERQSGSRVRLSWSLSCVSTDYDFEVYEGVLGDFTSHAARLCTTGGMTSATLEPSPGSSYYLVVPRNGAREGSYGRDSSGVERAPASAPCLPQAVTGSCG